MSRYIGDKEVADFLIKEEGFLDKPTDIGDGKVTLGSGLTDPKWHALYRKKGKWSKEDNRNAVLEEVAKRRVWAEDTIPNWEQLPESAQDALLSYKYNYNFTPTNSPNLFEAMREGNFFKAAEEINATSKDPKFRKGLEERRKREQEMFLSDLMPQRISNRSVNAPYTNNVVSDNTRVVRYPTREESTQFRTIVPERNYVETTTISPGEQRAQQLRNTFESTRDYNRMMQNISIQNNPQPTFTPQYNYHSDGGPLNIPKLWDDLSLTEKSDMIRVAVENDITTLPEIRKAYNEFAEGGSVDTINTYETGGYKPSENIKSRIAHYEGKAMTGARDPISGKWGKNNSFEAEARGFYKALPTSIREQVLNNPELADSLYSYSYNVGAGNFKKRVVPALERYYAGIGSVKDIEDSMWATHDSKLRGLQRRRAEEKAGVRNALMGEAMPLLQTEQTVPEFTPFNPQAFSTFMGVDGNYGNYVTPQVVDVEEPLVQAAMESAYSPEQIEREERAQGLRNLGLAMSIMRGNENYGNSSLWDTVGLLTGSQYKNGGKIHIKPSHRGRLTELKKRTGKTEAELYKNGSAATRKMITFARNARKWKHGLGGNLFSGEDTPTQQMNNGLNLYRRTNNLGETEYIYQETPDSEEILLTPTNKRFSDDPTNWDYKDANGREYSPRMTTTYNPGEIRKDARGPLERMVDNYFGELKYQANNNVPISGKYTMPAIAATPFLAWAGEAAYPYISTALTNPYVDAGITSAFAGHGLNHTINEGIDGWGDAAMTALELMPLGRLAKPVFRETASAVEGYRYPLGRPQVPEDYITLKPQIRTRVGDVEIDNPELYYHQADAGKAENFVSTGRMRTPLEEYWLAKEEAGEHIPTKLRAGIEPGYPQDPGSAMFAQGNLWYGLTPNKPDLLVTAREMPIANKNASIMSDKVSLRSLENQGSRRVTNDNIYTQGPHNRQNTSAYTWEPGYGYREVLTESPTTIGWEDVARAPQITAENELAQNESLKNMFRRILRGKPDDIKITKEMAEMGRKDLLNEISSPWYKERWKKATNGNDEQIDELLSRMRDRIIDVPIDYSKTTEQLGGEPGFITYGVTVPREPHKFNLSDGTPVTDYNTGLDVLVAANRGKEARNTAYHELQHYLTNKATGTTPYPSLKFINNGLYEPLITPLDNGELLIGRGDAWQHYIMDQNEALLPKKSLAHEEAVYYPESLKKRIIKLGRTPEEADNLILKLKDEAQDMMSIQEQRAHLKTWFTKDILPFLKNPNDASEIEKVLNEHPSIMKNIPENIKTLMETLRPGSVKDYAKYLAESLGIIPFINKNSKAE